MLLSDFDVHVRIGKLTVWTYLYTYLCFNHKHFLSYACIIMFMCICKTIKYYMYFSPKNCFKDL